MRIYGETRSLFFVVIRIMKLLILYIIELLNMKKGIRAVHIYFDESYLQESGKLKIIGYFYYSLEDIESSCN
jgi:2-hydroxy-3-keto-5-methylthiopentenyl-1-phosphate phosphatase